MSSKIGLIVSMLFFTLFFLLCVDVMLIQFNYSDLDAKSISISYDISRKGKADDEYINELENRYQVKISNVSIKQPEFGDMVEYVVYREYTPIIVKRETMLLRIKRSTIIGYY